MVGDVISVYKEYREAFLWIVTYVLTEKKAEDLGVDYNSIVLSLIHLIELIGKDINLKKMLLETKELPTRLKIFYLKITFLKIISKNRIRTFVQDFIILPMKSYPLMVINCDDKNTISERFPDIDTDDQS